MKRILSLLCFACAAYAGPLDDSRAPAVVLVFVRSDCPISNRYAPELRRLSAEFSALGVAFTIVYPDPAETTESAARHSKEYNLPGDIWLDPKQELVKLAHVAITPEAAVFLPGKRLAYHGRIDDRYVSFGKARSQPTRHDLEDALAAVLAGRPVAHASAPAIGCSIADLMR